MVFKKGQSGNPKGRPGKSDTLADIIREYLEKKKLVVTELKSGKEKIFKFKSAIKHEFIQRVLAKALSGDSVCEKLIMEYIDGKPKQYITTEWIEDIPNEELSQRAKDIIKKRANLLLLKQNKAGGKK